MPYRQMRALLSLAGTTFALLFVGWWFIHPAYAAGENLVVCPADGNGPEDQLRAAIVAVNTMLEFDSIIISVSGADCVFTLEDAAGEYDNGPVGLPLIERDLLIQSIGGRAIIERSASAPVFRLLESTANLTVESLTLRNGNPKYVGNSTAASGGAIYAHKALTLTDVIFTDNVSRRGGAVYAANSLVMNQVTATQNRTLTSNPSHGGGIYVEGNLLATNITVTNNIAEDCACGGDEADGGGIYVAGSAVISAGTFHANQSVRASGGGLYVVGDLTLTNSSFFSNSASYTGGGLQVDGNPVISGSDFIRNVADIGGGLYVEQGIATVEASTFISNHADYGGGAYVYRGTVQSSLFEENVAQLDGPVGGGGILVIAQGTIQSSRFISNSATIGGGVRYLFYPPDSTSGDSQVVNNLFVNNNATGGNGAAIAIGIDVDGYTGRFVEIKHNTITRQVRNSNIALYIAQSPSDVNNNIIAQHRIGIQAVDAVVIADANLFHANTANYFGMEGGQNDLNGDPQFIDPDHHDYHLQVGSPAQDSGLDLGVTVDMDGVSRPQGKGYERGAFEIVHINHPPIAQSDLYTTSLDTPLSVPVPGLLGNDSDPDGDELSAILATAPTHGELALQPVGSFIYTPTAGFTGTASFTYQASDGSDLSAVVTATINVVSEPSPLPVAIHGLTATNDGPIVVGLAVNFAASVETGSDIHYVWDFGDGATQEGATVSHIYLEPGTYDVTVTASNSLGTEQATTQVTVLPDQRVQNQTFLPSTAK